MMRHPNWRSALAVFIHDNRDKPFQWGAADCCLMAADAALAMTGRDFAEPLRGYASQFGAYRKLVNAGYYSVAHYLDTLFPRALRPQCGDVVMLAREPLGPLAIADGWGAFWGQDASGIIRAPLPAGAMAWRL